MKTKKKIIGVGLVAVACLGGCAAPRQPDAQIIHVKEEFVPVDYAWAKKEGKNVIYGQAMLRTNGGEVRTCAGQLAAIVPDAAYTRDRLQQMYGSVESGFNPVWIARRTKFDPDTSEYYSLLKKTICDAQGNFSFENLPDGTWYVVSEVSWGIPGSPQGGILMQKVKVAGGEKQKVIMAR